MGSVPDDASRLYTGPISIDDSTRIRARAFEPDHAPGFVSSQGYIALDATLASGFDSQPFESNLPLMVFDSFGETKVYTEKTRLVPVSAVLIDVDETGVANILDEPEFTGRAGLRVRGQVQSGFPKTPFALEFWEEGGDDSALVLPRDTDDRDVSFFGLPAESDWVLIGPYSDKTQLNDYLTFLWSGRTGQYASRTRLVEVFVNGDGSRLDFAEDYRGTYVVAEKVKIDEHRVDIASLSPADDDGDAVTGGYIWERNRTSSGQVLFETESGLRLAFTEPKIPTLEQYDWLTNHLNEFESVLYDPDFADPVTGYASYIDVDSWIDHWLVSEVIKDIDSFRLDTFYFKDRNGKINLGPIWDNDLALGNANYLKGSYWDGWYHDLLGGSAQYPYWDRLFEDVAFENRLVDRWFELRVSAWSTDQILLDIDNAVAQLTNGQDLDAPNSPIARNFLRWGTVDDYVWPNCFFDGIGGDCRENPLPSGNSPSKYSDYIFLLKDFITNRLTWIDEQFRDTVGNRGDVNRDGLRDVTDLELLQAGIRNGDVDPALDVNSDGAINSSDVTSWLSVVGIASIGRPFVRGDADLDGDVDATDLNSLGLHWRATESNWSDGDFTGDGWVMAADLNALALNWRHGVAAAAPTAGRTPRAPLPASRFILADVVPFHTGRRDGDMLASEFDEIVDESANEDAVNPNEFFTPADPNRGLPIDKNPENDDEWIFLELVDDVFERWPDLP